jgi:hypothetical protein
MRNLNTLLVSSVIALSPISAIANTATFSTENIVVDNFKCIPNAVSVFDEKESSANHYMSIISAWLSHERTPEKRVKQLKAWGFKKSFDIGKDGYGHRGFIAEHDNFILASFRGTQTRNDYVSNAMFYQAKFHKDLGIEGAKVHRGMAGVYRKTRKELFKKISMLSKEKPIHFVGHSLGGSLATLFAYKMEKDGFNVASISTAGQPKIGNKVLVDEINKLIGHKITTISLDSDITPMVPPTKESAEYFSSIISHKLPLIRNFFNGLVKKLDFTPNPGKHLILKTSSEIQLDEIGSDSEIIDRELVYWQNISSRLSDIDQTLSL